VQIGEFLLALPALLFSMVAHEYAHGYVALKQGDDTAYRSGRLTFNPVKHIDLWMTILLPLMMWVGSGGRMIFGGAKPVPVDPRRYRDPVLGDILVSSAGIMANILLVAVFAVLAAAVGVIGANGDASTLAPLQRMMFWGIWFNLLLANFNLIPVPPLDGSHLLKHALPREWQHAYRQVSRYGMLLLLILVFFGSRVLVTLLTPAILSLRVILQRLDPVTLAPFGLF
jgi:Zn-dependent protease